MSSTGMNWQKWVVLAWLALSALILIGRVGRTRTVTAGEAVAGAIEVAAVAWLVVAS